MDSLLASYASSDDDEEQRNISSPAKPTPLPPNFSSFLSTLPPPNFLSLIPSASESSHENPRASIDADGQGGDERGPSKPYTGRQSSSALNSNWQPMGNPKSTVDDGIMDDGLPDLRKSSVFNLIPKPQSLTSGPLSSVPAPKKKVVQFRPPVIPINFKDDKPDELEEEIETKERKPTQFSTPSLTKSLLSMMPAPKSSTALGAGALPSSGSHRKSIIETEEHLSNPVNSDLHSGSVAGQNAHYLASDRGNELYADPDSLKNAEFYSNYGAGVDQHSTSYSSDVYSSSFGTDQPSASYENYAAYDQSVLAGNGSTCYGEYNAYGDYVSYVDHHGLDDGSLPIAMPKAEMKRVKRGKNEMPSEIVEVKQDDLMKNRPREDKSKMTGLAFGPSYQPAPSSKGKPSKLHKRKHQINSLYFDMKQKEMELAERRSRGLLTKAETHAKYGW